MPDSWEDELREYFPAYLLPASATEALSRAAASRFLDRLTKRADALTLLLAVSALAPRADDVREFARQLRLLTPTLPSSTEMERVETDGQLRGRMDVPATLKLRHGGNPGRMVSRTRRRRFDLPENVLLTATAQRLAALLIELDDAGTVIDLLKARKSGLEPGAGNWRGLSG
jgi:hypothetical protein